MGYCNIKAHPELTHLLPSPLGPYERPLTPPLPHPLPCPCLSPSLTKHKFIKGEITFSKEGPQSIKPQAQGPLSAEPCGCTATHHAAGIWGQGNPNENVHHFKG